MASVAANEYHHEVNSNVFQSSEDGFFMCEVSVHHKLTDGHESEPPSRPSSAQSRSSRLSMLGPKRASVSPVAGEGRFCLVSMKKELDMSSVHSGEDQGRKVVWPANQAAVAKETIETSRLPRENFKSANERIDQPFKWIKRAGSETGIDQSDHQPARGRVSRSRSRSRNIAERARSFERGSDARMADNNSRAGSASRRQRSSSGNRQQMEDSWCHQIERPASRTDVDSRRFGEIGRVNTMEWEERIHGSVDNIPGKIQAPKRREVNIFKNNSLQDREAAMHTPEPPPPPSRLAQVANQREETPPFPPPPPSNADTRSKLSEDSVSMLIEENKENIIKQWMESTSSASSAQKELERFAYDIAESVVDSMERNSTRKDEECSKSTTNKSTSSMEEIAKNQLVKQFWERQMSIPSQDQQLLPFPNEPLPCNPQRETGGSGTFHAVPAVAQTLHGPIYVQDQSRRVGMTFQQEERRRQELRMKEEERQEERRQQALLKEEQERRQQALMKEEEERQLEYQRQKQREAEMKRREEAEKRELERREQERLAKEQETKRMMEKRAEEERIRRENEQKRIEMERLRMEEMKRQELERYEKLRQEEEMKRQEEIRLEQEMRRQYEAQMAAKEMEKKRQNEESVSVRGHIPKLAKTKSFEVSQEKLDQSNRFDDHLGKVKTGQVNEKRNFWMRSSSVDRLSQSMTSPAPRRRRLDGWNVKQKENTDPDSRPGSSLGHAAQTGSIKNIASGFLSKSKSSTAISNGLEVDDRARPKQKVMTSSWTKEKYDQNTNMQRFQEVKTNHVNETINTWGKQEQNTSGRVTPVPSKTIGQVFSENKIGKMENDKQANAWRQKTSEPSVKLVNVSVEKAVGSGQNIHISENAQMQMASYMQETVSKTQTITESCSQSSIMQNNVSSVIQASPSRTQQPPPLPERNQSFGGKSSDVFSPQKDNLVQSERTEPILEKTANKAATFCQFNIDNNSERCGGSVSCQDQNQQSFHQPSQLQSSYSGQSINSLVSNCSSGALPLPVRQGWFDDLERMSTASASTVPTSSQSTLQGIMSPTGTGKTPLPVVAQWFSGNLPERQGLQKGHPAQLNQSIDDIDAKSVKSDTTVIENKIEEPPVQSDKVADNDQSSKTQVDITEVPPSPKEIRKKFQEMAPFEKQFQKSADLELSDEFRLGVQGKVKDLKKNIYSQAQNQKLAEAKEQRDSEIREVKLQRTDSKQFDDPSNEKLEIIKKEKYRELDLIKRSRSKSQIKDDEAVESAYLQEKQIRDAELALLSKRSVKDWDIGGFSSTAEKKAKELREEREKELAELSNRPNVLQAEEEFVDPNANHDFEHQEQVFDDSGPDSLYVREGRAPEAHSRGRFSGAMDKWREREKSMSQERPADQTPRHSPTKKIGSMFKRDPDYWGDEMVQSGNEWSGLEDLTSPPPPPRQSSRGRVEEYGKFTAWTQNVHN